MKLEQFVYETIKQIQDGIERARKESIVVRGPKIVDFDCQISPDGEILPGTNYCGIEPRLRFSVIIDRR